MLFCVMKRIILASNSPRRKEILQSLGVRFSTVASHFDESTVQNPDPVQRCILTARGKANALLQTGRSTVKNAFIIAADTLVYKGAVCFGKPQSISEAEAMLLSYSGTYHKVITAVCCVDFSCRKEYEKTNINTVVFKKFSPHEIADYLKTGEWQDAAGGYKIQGKASLFIEKINGSYSGIMGLPVSELYEIFKEAGIPVLKDSG